MSAGQSLGPNRRSAGQVASFQLVPAHNTKAKHMTADQDFLNLRARYESHKAEFYAGKRDDHPAGATGRNHLLPPEDGRKIWGWDDYQAVTPRHMYIVT